LAKFVAGCTTLTRSSPAFITSPDGITWTAFPNTDVVNYWLDVACLPSMGNGAGGSGVLVATTSSASSGTKADGSNMGTSNRIVWTVDMSTWIAFPNSYVNGTTRATIKRVSWGPTLNGGAGGAIIVVESFQTGVCSPPSTCKNVQITDSSIALA